MQANLALCASLLLVPGAEHTCSQHEGQLVHAGERTCSTLAAMPLCDAHAMRACRALTSSEIMAAMGSLNRGSRVTPRSHWFPERPRWGVHSVMVYGLLTFLLGAAVLYLSGGAIHLH